MLLPRFRRVVVLALVLALAASWAVAEPRVRHESAAVELRAADLLSTLWETLRSIWAENGCGLDPFGCPSGQTTPEPPSGQGDNGCSAAPYGCPTIQGDNGCHADPYGCPQG
jgi:hypothetical protein